MSLFASYVRPGSLKGRLLACVVASRFVFTACLLAQAPPADPLLTEAQRWLKEEEYDAAMPMLLQSANHGHPAAMRELGLVYSRGLGSKMSDPKWGLQWFQRAALGGDVPSAFHLAELYAKGALGRPDDALARFWYAKDDAANDAHGPMGLAELACGGAGEKQDLDRCSRLLLRAGTLQTADGSDLSSRLAADWHTLGASYQAEGTRQRTLAAAAYRHAGMLGDPDATLAESNLFLKPGDGPVDLAMASAALDSYVATYKSSHPHIDGMPGYAAIGSQYVTIGRAYETRGDAQTAHAVPVYAAAAKLGMSHPAVQLALRYAKGKGVARNLDSASKQLLALADPYPQSPAAKEYLAALQYVARACLSAGDTAAHRAVAKSLSDRADEVRYAPPPPRRPPPVVRQFAAAGMPPAAVQARYPNLIAPPTVTPLQRFPVMVSLNTTQFDTRTVVVSGGQPNGEITISLPPGITAVQIGVTLIAPAMTSVDGVYSQNIELTRDQDSTTAVFQLQAGSAAGTSPVLATLTYNGAFLAQIRRDVTVGDAVVASAPPVVSPPSLAPKIVTLLPPVTPQPVAPQPCVEPSNDVTPAPPVGPVHLDPEQRAPDMMIQETQICDWLTYTVYAPGLGFATTVVPGAAQRQAIVAKLYSDLESQGNNLDQIGGKSASQQAKDFAEGKGSELYDRMAPDAFKMMYAKLVAAGVPPRTIQVLTSSPTLPWELLRPMLADGTRQDFLGMTAALVRGNAASVPRVPPPLSEQLHAVKVVAPVYDGDVSLAGAQQEVIALKTSFPALNQVNGTVDDVSALGRALPDGIIHYAGHGLRVTTDGLPPDVALSLSDGSMVPSTWQNLAEQHPAVHPFYFFNACDLGRSDAQLDYISGWAVTLMQSGASGYLGALWKVSDTTATSFATHFYKDLKIHLSSNDPWSVAEVVTAARRETYEESFDPTALAYILYSAPYLTMTDQE